MPVVHSVCVDLQMWTGEGFVVLSKGIIATALDKEGQYIYIFKDVNEGYEIFFSCNLPLQWFHMERKTVALVYLGFAEAGGHEAPWADI